MNGKKIRGTPNYQKFGGSGNGHVLPPFPLFTGPEKTLPNNLDLISINEEILKGEILQTNKPNIFTAGDAKRGQSLIVWAISEGRETAHQVDSYLMGKSNLPQKNKTGDLVAI
ncbi:MAG: hypothetical protein CM15mP40_09260 [Alphaproteobacteria bacterium]|nr:MAG: hypothetical protein CM15mP40_09260 [Alphaproteobacteria bacterium]